MEKLFVGLCMLLFVFPGLLFAADAVTTVGGVSVGWSDVIQAVVALIMTIITAYLIPYLKAKAMQARVRVAASAQEASASLWLELRAFLFDGAAAIVERQFLKIAEDVKDGELKTPADVKRRLYVLGQRLRADALQYFNVRGVDLLRVIGNEALDRLIEQASNKVSPFPGKDTAKAFLQDTVADAIIDYGVTHVRDLFADSSIVKTLLSKATKPRRK